VLAPAAAAGPHLQVPARSVPCPLAAARRPLPDGLLISSYGFEAAAGRLPVPPAVPHRIRRVRRLRDDGVRGGSGGDRRALNLPAPESWRGWGWSVLREMRHRRARGPTSVRARQGESGGNWLRSFGPP